MGKLNLGYTFYRKIEEADNVDFGANIVDRAKDLKEDSKNHFDIKDSLKLTFKTGYPSLSIGLGYAHDTSENDDFKLGFLFDFTTGLPYIPGSSLKGTIRSMFPIDKDDKERLEFINDILKKLYSYDELYQIEKLMFGKSTKDIDSKDNSQTKDIFYDGYFVTNMGSFLESDYITPHNEDEITSPDPLKFLKITPGTKVILQIQLKENELISKEDRLKLYSEILQWTGLGAKTNVGYGAIDNIKFEYDKISETKLKSFLEGIEKLKREKKINKAKEDDNAIIVKLSGVEKIKKQIENEDNNKVIFETISSSFSELSDDEKSDLFNFVVQKIGKKPTKSKPAKRRWAIEIYNLFGK